MTGFGDKVVRRQGAIVPYGDDALMAGKALRLITRADEIGTGWAVATLPQSLQTEAFEGEYVYLQREVQAAEGSVREACLLIRSDRVDSTPGARYIRKVRASAPEVALFRASADVIAGYLRAQNFISRRTNAPINRVSIAEQRAYDLYKAAMEVNASDIHIEVVTEGRYAPQYLIRMRVDGYLVEVESRKTQEDLDSVEEMIRTMYQHPEYANEKERSPSTFSPGARCKGRLTPPMQGLVLRFESDPTATGYTVALRLLGHKTSDGARKSLEDLGLSSYQARALYRASSLGTGLILVMGDTGSGKTTTLATLLELDPDKHRKKRISLEDPPEMEIESVTHLRVSAETLPEVAIGVVRQDPDVVYVGEINSPITAGIAQSMALTGHTTFGTFHANDCVQTLQRLISDHIGMNLTVLGGDRFLRALLFQRLLPRLCYACRIPAEDAMDSEDLEVFRTRFGIDTRMMFVARKSKGEGCCIHCGGAGELGRVLVAELIVPDRRFSDLVLARRFNEAMDHYRKQRVASFADASDTRGKTWVEHALGRAANGEVCMREILKLEVWENYELVELNERAAGASK